MMAILYVNSTLPTHPRVSLSDRASTAFLADLARYIEAGETIGMSERRRILWRTLLNPDMFYSLLFLASETLYQEANRAAHYEAEASEAVSKKRALRKREYDASLSRIRVMLEGAKETLKHFKELMSAGEIWVSAVRELVREEASAIPTSSSASQALTLLTSDAWLRPKRRMVLLFHEGEISLLPYMSEGYQAPSVFLDFTDASFFGYDESITISCGDLPPLSLLLHSISSLPQLLYYAPTLNAGPSVGEHTISIAVQREDEDGFYDAQIVTPTEYFGAPPALGYHAHGFLAHENFTPDLVGRTVHLSYYGGTPTNPAQVARNGGLYTVVGFDGVRYAKPVIKLDPPFRHGNPDDKQNWYVEAEPCVFYVDIPVTHGGYADRTEFAIHEFNGTAHTSIPTEGTNPFRLHWFLEGETDNIFILGERLISTNTSPVGAKQLVVVSQNDDGVYVRAFSPDNAPDLADEWEGYESGATLINVANLVEYGTTSDHLDGTPNPRRALKAVRHGDDVYIRLRDKLAEGSHAVVSSDTVSLVIPDHDFRHVGLVAGMEIYVEGTAYTVKRVLSPTLLRIEETVPSPIVGAWYIPSPHYETTKYLNGRVQDTPILLPTTQSEDLTAYMAEPLSGVENTAFAVRPRPLPEVYGGGVVAPIGGFSSRSDTQSAREVKNLFEDLSNPHFEYTATVNNNGLYIEPKLPTRSEMQVVTTLSNNASTSPPAFSVWRMWLTRLDVDRGESREMSADEAGIQPGDALHLLHADGSLYPSLEIRKTDNSLIHLGVGLKEADKPHFYIEPWSSSYIYPNVKTASLLRELEQAVKSADLLLASQTEASKAEQDYISEETLQQHHAALSKLFFALYKTGKYFESKSLTPITCPTIRNNATKFIGHLREEANTLYLLLRRGNMLPLRSDALFDQCRTTDSTAINAALYALYALQGEGTDVTASEDGGDRLVAFTDEVHKGADEET